MGKVIQFRIRPRTSNSTHKSSNNLFVRVLVCVLQGLLRERYRELVYENGYYRRLITRYKMMMDVREAMDDDGASSASSCSTDSACSWEEVRDSKPDSTSQV